MSKKMKLENLEVASFTTVKREGNRQIKGGDGSNYQGCPTALFCPTVYPACTSPYVGC